jgi:hypothetical protein
VSAFIKHDTYPLLQTRLWWTNKSMKIECAFLTAKLCIISPIDFSLSVHECDEWMHIHFSSHSTLYLPIASTNKCVDWFLKRFILFTVQTLLVSLLLLYVLLRRYWIREKYVHRKKINKRKSSTEVSYCSFYFSHSLTAAFMPLPRLTIELMRNWNGLHENGKCGLATANNDTISHWDNGCYWCWFSLYRLA